MNKKEKKQALKAWHWKCIRLMLLSEESHQDGNDTRNGSDNGTNVRNALTLPSSIKAAFVHSNPTFVSYLVAIGVLIKQAFRHKKGKHFILLR